MSKETTNYVDEEELKHAEEEAEKEENPGLYTHRFKQPWTYEGKTYEEITFDFGKLTGRDYLSIEDEMQALGRSLISPTFSGQFLARLASRASTTKVGSDVIQAMPIYDFTRIRNAARNFMLRAEL